MSGAFLHHLHLEESVLKLEIKSKYNSLGNEWLKQERFDIKVRQNLLAFAKIPLLGWNQM